MYQGGNMETFRNRSEEASLLHVSNRGDIPGRTQLELDDPFHHQCPQETWSIRIHMKHFWRRVCYAFRCCGCCCAYGCGCVVVVIEVFILGLLGPEGLNYWCAYTSAFLGPTSLISRTTDHLKTLP